jgi:DNA repair protein SbcD/Mre11
MRLLHVSDLHLGRALGDLSREPEQRDLVGELVAAADELEVALTLISGDVFDGWSPPAWAEDLFFELIDGLAAGGQRAVAVIAGNHDSGLRLAAADPLARRLGIVLAGNVGEPCRGFEGGGDRVRVTPLAPQVVRIEVPGADAPIIAGLLPFLSEAKVAREGETGRLADLRGDGSRYEKRLAAELAARAAFAEPGAVRVLALHQHVTGGTASDSERRLRLRPLGDLDASAIPAGLDYVALGHLHRPQAITGSASPALYAGSPIAYSFSEADQIKRAVLIDTAKGRAARITSVPLGSGRPLAIWTVRSIDEARDHAARADAGNFSPIVEVRADLGRRLDPGEGCALFNLGRSSGSPFLPGVTVVAVRDLHDPSRRELSREPAEGRPELSAPELFRELWKKKHGSLPDEETVEELCGALLDVTRGEEEAESRAREAAARAGGAG